MTIFQNKCIHECSIFLEKRFPASTFTFKEISGKTEIYYVCAFNSSGHLIEIYVYGKEAGFMIDKTDWHAFEIAAFDSERELISTLMVDLNDFLDK